MVGLFVAALFTSAMLLFWVQPMVAKLLLPLLGGTPTVWNTCMVFFQAMLLAGYGYAHFLTTRFRVRTQIMVHLGLMLIAFVALPIGLGDRVSQSAPWDSNPFIWLIGVLFVVVALPFFVLSASAPLLQSWFSRMQHRSAGDPYFLYAASNLGSMLGLLAYPLLLEPHLRLGEQGRFWTGTYALLVVLFGSCAWLLGRRMKRNPPGATTAESTGTPAMETQPITGRRRLAWVLWAFVPSSLLLGITTYLTSDIASVPLLWVVPLSLYLLSFIVVFSRIQLITVGLMARLVPMAAIVLVFVTLMNPQNLVWLQLLVHLGFFLLAALLGHGHLALDRPPPRHLTEFYFWMSLGGVLGGAFTALAAPLIFPSVVEYPLMIVAACLMSARRTEWMRFGRRWVRVVWPPLVIGIITLILVFLIPRLIVAAQLRIALTFGFPIILSYAMFLWSREHLRFALAIGAVLFASHFYMAQEGRVLHRERNFFGAMRVTLDPEGQMYRLYHGTTVHGMQFLAEELRGEPLAYYHRVGPCGQAMEAMNARPGITRVGVIGLGVGSMIAYARPGQHWTFYEIDPAVIRIARDTRYFTYLQRYTNAVSEFKLGDARLRLREAAPGQFDVLVCDAFGSDAPPLHLITREAMELYLSKLAPEGVLLMHLSSRYLDFRPVMGNLAAHFNLVAIATFDDAATEDTLRQGRLPSLWVAVARRPEDLGALQENLRWEELQKTEGMRLWTDDYSNILSVFDWH